MKQIKIQTFRGHCYFLFNGWERGCVSIIFGFFWLLRLIFSLYYLIVSQISFFSLLFCFSWSALAHHKTGSGVPCEDCFLGLDFFFFLIYCCFEVWPFFIFMSCLRHNFTMNWLLLLFSFYIFESFGGDILKDANLDSHYYRQLPGRILSFNLLFLLGLCSLTHVIWMNCV